MMIKETVEIFSAAKIQTYSKKLENWGQWTLILLTLTLIPFSNMMPESVEKPMSIVS